jgi:uncharacterized protein YodC (DUF2158 family)
MITGTLVQLKSGGPVMTVMWINGDEAYCNWFDDRNELKGSKFRTLQLKIIDGDGN